jgi:hypothetical protein
VGGDAPAACTMRRRALWEKAMLAGASLLASALSSRWMPHSQAIAGTRVLLPMSMPTTLITTGREITSSVFNRWGWGGMVVGFELGKMVRRVIGQIAACIVRSSPFPFFLMEASNGGSEEVGSDIRHRRCGAKEERG